MKTKYRVVVLGFLGWGCNENPDKAVQPKLEEVKQEMNVVPELSLWSLNL